MGEIKMFIDYVTLMLVNMAAGLCILAFFVATAVHKDDNRCWWPAFAIAGLTASVTGFAMTFTWPLPYPYNIAFGELSVMFGLLYLATALSLAKSLNLMPISIYAVLAGTVAILVGVRFINLGLSAAPILSGVGFILTGSTGVLMPLLVYLKKVKAIRLLGAILPLAAAFIWGWTGYTAYWHHLLPK
jgi:putative membrane protein